STTYTVYKVPNSRIYFYKDSADITLDYTALETMVSDGNIIANGLAQPFTFVVADPDAQLSLAPLATSDVNDVVNALIIADSIFFNAGIACDDTDVFKGLFIAPGGFSTIATRNDDITRSGWCAGGNMIIQ